MTPTQSRRYLRKFTFARTVDQVSNSRCAMLLRHTETARGVDAVNTLRVAQVLPRRFASFRAFKFSISAVQRAFESGFDSRQLHKSNWSEPRALASFPFHQHGCRDTSDGVASATVCWVVAGARCVVVHQRPIGVPSNDGALPVATRCDIYWTQLHLSRFAIMTREVCGTAIPPSCAVGHTLTLCAPRCPPSHAGAALRFRIPAKW
jgi:hypothetical protein